MSETLILIIVFGLLFYLMHRSGGHGMGCCGGHSQHGHGEEHYRSKKEQDENKERHHQEFHH